jgi:hypothetical protein
MKRRDFITLLGFAVAGCMVGTLVRGAVSEFSAQLLVN